MNCILNIFVNDRIIDKFIHNNEVYVEGRKGKSYTIKYYNNTNKRQKIVVSVDGLNVMTGDNTWERGYVVDAYKHIEIPGWRKDAENTAAFIFSSVRNSYNNLNDNGDIQNVGVIGCKVYKEIEKPQVQNHYYLHQPLYGPYYWPNVQPYNPWNITYVPWSYNNGGAAVVSSYNGYASGASLNVTDTVTLCSSVASANQSNMKATMTCGVVSEPQNAIGTGWGENVEFQTQAVHIDFEASPCETFIIYYDDRRGLEKRGVIMNPIKEVRKPKAFPDGCPEPKYSYLTN